MTEKRVVPAAANLSRQFLRSLTSSVPPRRLGIIWNRVALPRDVVGQVVVLDGVQDGDTWLRDNAGTRTKISLAQRHGIFKANKARRRSRARATRVVGASVRATKRKDGRTGFNGGRLGAWIVVSDTLGDPAERER